MAAAACSSRRPAPPGAPQYADAASLYRRGEYKACARTVDSMEKAWLRPADEDGWKWRFLRAELTRMADAGAALELLNDAPPGDLADVRALWHIRRCRALSKLREFDAALREAQEARKALRSTTPLDIRLEIGVYEALANWQAGDREQGERLMEKVGEEAAAGDSPYDEATAFSNLAFFNYHSRRFDAAMRFGERAIAAARKAGAKRVFASAAPNLAANYDELGFYEKAVSLLEEAVPLAREVEDRVALQNGLGELGRAWLLMGQYEKAISYISEAYTWGSEVDSITSAGNLAYAYLLLKKPGEAETWNELAQPARPEKDQEDFAYYASNASEVARLKGDLPGAMQSCRAALALAPRSSNIERALHAQMGSLYLESKSLDEAKGEFELALRDVETGQRQLSDESMQVGFLSRLIQNYQMYVGGLVANGEEELALQVAERSRARVLALRMGRGGSASTRNARDLARLTGSTLLSYWLAPEESYLWVITSKQIRLVKLPGAGEINRLVNDFRKTVEENQRDPLDDPAGKELYTRLVLPAADLIPHGGRVIIVPDGSLHHINFESLPVPGSKPHYWLEDAVVSIAPALTLIEPQKKRPVEASVLAIGAPLTVDRANYPELPGTREEISDVRRLFAAVQAFEGKDATPDALFRASTRKASIVHFAAHGESNESAPLESAIILSRNERGAYKLYARDLKDLNLDADLVTLSACRSAGSRSYAGEGLLGFAWAFLQSGARTVVAGLWDVRDRPTTALMRDFYEGIAAGKSPAQSLHDAKLQIVRGTQVNWHRAYNWAAFQCYLRTVVASSTKSGGVFQASR
jgi:CHAT domain-containing protein